MTDDILVLRHWNDNDLGHLAPVLQDLDLAPVYLEAHQEMTVFPNPANYAGVVILGAHYNVDDVAAFPGLLAEKRFIRDALSANRPLFGICFGAQLLASVCGAPVRREQYAEKGWVNIALTPQGQDDPVFGRFAPALRQFHWHDDSFEMPPQATLLAESRTCPTQILRVGEKAYGVQFHPEVTPAIIETWLTQSVRMTETQKTEMRAAVIAHYETARTEGQALFRAFWDYALA